MSNQLDFGFNLQLQFLLKHCHSLISETIEEDIDLYTWDVEERQGMLEAIDEAMNVLCEYLPKFKVNFKNIPKLKLVPKQKINEGEQPEYS